MQDWRVNSYGRWAIWIMLIALLLLLFTLTWMYFLQHTPVQYQEVGETTGKLDPRAADRRDTSKLLGILLLSVLIILVYVVGSYLLIKLGRAVASSDKKSPPTEYSDAWSQYRLTEEEIEQATEEPLTDPRSGNRGPEGEDDEDEGDENAGPETKR